MTPGVQGMDTNSFIQHPTERNEGRDLDNTQDQRFDDSMQGTLFHTSPSAFGGTNDISQISPALISDLLVRFQQQQQS